MTRFSELLEKQKPRGKSGLDTFGTDKCDLCHEMFDPQDAKIWTRETGKVHFSPCYVEWRKEQKISCQKEG